MYVLYVVSLPLVVPEVVDVGVVVERGGLVSMIAEVDSVLPRV